MKRRHKWTYALPELPIAYLTGGPIFLVQGIYAKYFGVSLEAIALVLLISRVFDGITDPLIGYFSDKYWQRHGSRKPFVLCGCLMLIICNWFLLAPLGYDVNTGETTVSATYFCVLFMAFYLAFTLFQIPHLAWVGDLTASTSERNEIFGLRATFAFSGSIIFYLIPYLPIFTTTDYTPETLRWSAIVAAFIMAPSLIICLKWTPNDNISTGKCSANRAPQQPSKRNPETLMSTLRSISSNRPYLMLTCGLVATGLGSSMYYTMLFFAIDSYFGLGEIVSIALASSLAISMFSLKLWILSAAHLGRRRTLVLGMTLVVAGLLGFSFLSPEKTDAYIVLILMGVIGSGFACLGVMVQSYIADIADYGEWRFGLKRISTYFSIYAMINKGAFAIGGSIGLAIAARFSFDPTLAVQIGNAALGMKITFSWLPACFIFLSLFFFANIPLSEKNMVAIQKRLKRREFNDNGAQT